MAKPREGFEAYVPGILDLYEDNPVALSVKGLDIEETRSDLNDYLALVAAEKEAAEKLAVITKTRALMASNVWRTTLAIYKRAESAAANDPEFLRAIASFEKFMKHARRRRVTPVTPPGTTGTT